MKTPSKITTKGKEKPKNYIGMSYKHSNRIGRMRFEAAILDASEADGFNYWRTFRLKWQYEPITNKIPYLYVKTAEQHLKLEPDLPEGYFDTFDMMFALKMESMPSNF